MTASQFNRYKGVTLIEVMLAITVLALAVLGASAYRYHCAWDVNESDVHTSAARIGHLLSESWRGLDGSESYDPAAHLGAGLTVIPITQTIEIQAVQDEGLNLLGGYIITVDGVNYYAILSWKDVETGLRALNVMIGWPQQEKRASNEERVSNIVSDFSSLKFFEITTYTLN